MTEEKVNLKETVNLPETEFPMRAGLLTKEPEYIAKWAQIGLHEKRAARQENFDSRYTLHDGPPYPNGNIHMGHALNKVLKDIANRSQWMNGRKIDYIPGWDCHGLPIETQVIKELKKAKEEGKKNDVEWFRDRCKTFAIDYVESQKSEFKRLGIDAKWDTPYLTLNPAYEAQVICLFGQMAQNGLIYQGRKPIHWCSHCETALAEAEIEYDNHKSPSIFVTFPVTTPSPALSSLLGDASASIMVWTTTPWTLPANVAIAAHPDFSYVVFNSDKGPLICVEELADSLVETLELDSIEIIGKISGQDLSQTIAQHPFLNQNSPVVLADYVTKEDGTGFVHIAPGHGQDDYIVGQKYGLPVVMPVNEKGQLDESTDWPGTYVFDANKAITQRLESDGRLLKLKFIKHSYPHCWRCKHPVIFRATEQWFVAMDTPMAHTGTTLRDAALKEIDTVNWFPDWGEKRIRSMVEGRPDWCISRQRKWGIPIPVFRCKSCQHPEMTGPFNDRVVSAVSEHGSMVWFTQSARDILGSDLTCRQCGHDEFEKEQDILDVWFESGASFGSVIQDQESQQFPADLYLEGSDQHRGWFQSSLLIGIGATGKSPYRSVLTHGFLVDNKGRKMSKSMGNVISPQKVIDSMGADVLRWWVLNTDFKQDVALSDGILKQARDSFSKVRNTLRFLLSNLYDFNEKTDAIELNDLNEIDRWVLVKYDELQQKVLHAYDKFDYHIIAHSVHDFCAVTLSSQYLDSVKDRLYCDLPSGQTRRSTQTALNRLFSGLTKLLAPVLVFSMEDAYTYWAPGENASIHLELFDSPNFSDSQSDLLKKWQEMMEIKSKIYQELEQWRNDKRVKSFMECHIDLSVPSHIEFDDWASLLIVSQVNISRGNDWHYTLKIAEGDKCQRCWRILPLQNALCNRCHHAIK